MRLKGFTLIETLIALAILVIVAFGVIGALTIGIKIIGQSKARVGATSLVNKRMEMLRNLAYNDIGTIGGIPSGAIPQEETIILNNIEYTLETFVQYVDDLADGEGVSDENGIVADYKRARVEVSWPGKYTATPVVAVSDFVPKGIETDVGGGTLIINVLTAPPYQPITQANIHIVNSEVDPPIDINTETSDQGRVVFPGSPSVGKYEITVTKSGYSTAQTYDATLENPNPDPGHLTILEGRTTEATFFIDLVSFLAVNTVEPKGESVWDDYFVSDIKVVESSNMDIGGGEAKLSAVGGGVQWWDSSWLYRKKITIDHTKVSGDPDLLSFPVLINFISDSDLAADAQDDGDDILFTSSDGITKLDHEIEEFDGSTGKLITWVKADLSGDTDTVFYMYYGNSGASIQENPTGVWDSNLKQVLHLKESPNGTPDEIKDSTLNANHGTAEGSATSPSSIEAKIGKGLAFDESDGLVRVYDSVSLDSINDEGTLEMWIKWVEAADGDWQIIMTSSNRFTTGAKDGFEWASQDDGDHYFYPWGGTDSDYNLGLNPFTDGQWHYLVVTLKDTTIREVKIYVDTNSMTFTIENVPTYWTQLASPSDWLWGGNPDRPTRYFNGVFDEIRVSDIVRSTGWVTTSYNNQNSPSTFYSLGEEEYRIEYFSSGYFVSTTINPDSLVNWIRFSWNDEEPENTDIKYQVFYYTGANWEPLSEDILPGNTAGFDDPPVDLIELDSVSYPILRLRGLFATASTSVTPILSDWQVRWNDNIEVPLGNVSFTMTGAKTIGEGVYKYSQIHTTNSSGHLDIFNLEWDVYDISSTKISAQFYDIAASLPSEPINIQPNTSNTLKLTLVPHASHTLLVTVKNAGEELLTNASVRLFKSGYDENILTGESGQSFFTPLTKATDYSLRVSKAGYEDYSLDDIEVNEQSEITVIMSIQ